MSHALLHSHAMSGEGKQMSRDRLDWQTRICFGGASLLAIPTLLLVLYLLGGVLLAVFFNVSL